MPWRKIRKYILYVLAAIVIYLVVGLIVPFLQKKSVKNTSGPDKLIEQAMTDKKSPDRAMILETNQSALEERIRLIHMAKERIVLTTFDMREGESTSDILSLLYQKAEAGVKIQILIDGVSGALRLRGVPLFQTIASHENIEIRIYNELNPVFPWKAMGRMHDKYVIVDQMAYILGGRNTFDYFIGNYITKGISYDREALIYNTDSLSAQKRADSQTSDSSIFELYQYFEEMWNYPECKTYDGGGISDDETETVKTFLGKRYQHLKDKYPQLFSDYDYCQSTDETKGVTLLKNEKHIYSKEPLIFYELTELMKRAKKKAVIHTPYIVADDYMLSALTDVCKKVPVTLMTNARENGDNVVASSDYTYHRSDVLSTGVSLLEYMGGVSYHGKSVVIDDELAIIGSYNFDMRSTYVDTELMLAIRSKDVCTRLNRYMEDYHKDSCPVKKDGGRENPEGIDVKDLPPVKNAIFHTLGLILQPFRILV